MTQIRLHNLSDTLPRNGRCQLETGGAPYTNLRWSLKAGFYFFDRRWTSIGLFELQMNSELVRMESMSLSLLGVSRCIKKMRPQLLLRPIGLLTCCGAHVALQRCTILRAGSVNVSKSTM